MRDAPRMSTAAFMARYDEMSKSICQVGYIATTARAKVLKRRSTEAIRNGRTRNSAPAWDEDRTRFGMDINDGGGMRIRARRQMRYGHGLLGRDHQSAHGGPNCFPCQRASKQRLKPA